MIELSNLMQDEGLSLHWHGLHMKGQSTASHVNYDILGLTFALEIGANEMDGTVGITQKAIPAGSKFTYKFQIGNDQAGTFW